MDGEVSAEPTVQVVKVVEPESWKAVWPGGSL